MINQNRLYLFPLLLLLISILVAACGSSSTNTTTATTTSIPTSDVSFSQDIQVIFNLNCVVCHQGISPSGGLNLEPDEAYQNLVNVYSMQSSLELVSPGSSENSYLWYKLTGTQRDVGGNGIRMPYNSPPLQQDKLDLIKKWIDEDAHDN